MVQHKTNRYTVPAASLQTNHSLYSQLFSKSSDLIFILSANLRIEYANPAAVSFFKFSRASYADKAFSSYLPEDSAAKLVAALDKSRHSGSQLRIEVDCGEMMEGAITPRTGGGFYVALRDISQERQVQELIRESQKMEALQYFVAGTTKEIQYPLLATLKKIEDFENKYSGRSFEYIGYKEFAQIMNFLKVIHGQIQSCYDTTAKLTNLNKKRLKFESHHCSGNAVIREIVKMLEPSLQEEHIKFRLRLSDKLPLIALGEIELNEIINHIISNALQAMPAGGHLAVSTSPATGGHEVRIDITDDGVGISPDDLPHIFEPFFTTKQRGADHSIGLGLSIVYSLVKAAHGQIKVKSSLRKGTTVQLTLPAVEPQK